VNVQTDSESDKVDVGRTFGGVVMSLLGGGALFWGSVLFAFYGVCEDSCDKPPRTLGGALHVAVPWAFGALRNSDSATLFIFGAIVLVCAWQALTIMSARHMARRR
jgi:hypothetical protein